MMGWAAMRKPMTGMMKNMPMREITLTMASALLAPMAVAAPYIVAPLFRTMVTRLVAACIANDARPSARIDFARAG